MSARLAEGRRKTVRAELLGPLLLVVLLTGEDAFPALTPGGLGECPQMTVEPEVLGRDSVSWLTTDLCLHPE